MSFPAETSKQCSGDGDPLVETVGPRVDISMRGDCISGFPKGQAQRRKMASHNGAVARIVREVKDARRKRGITHCYPSLVYAQPPHDEAGDADTESLRNAIMIQALGQLSDGNADDHGYGVE